LVRILIAEDNELIAFNLVDMLRELECVASETTREVAAGLDLLEHMSFDIAIIDVVLADGTSEPLMEALRQRGVPFAISSGLSEADLRFDYPGVPILAKPYGMSEVAYVFNSLTSLPSRHMGAAGRLPALKAGLAEINRDRG
jgi:DNA-binding response OmpR family regulator